MPRLLQVVCRHRDHSEQAQQATLLGPVSGALGL